MDQFTMIGTSASIRKVRNAITKASQAPYPILITGESGTGKELVARAIHDHGKHASQPFIALCCGSISPTLIESILYGHTRGAYTGAHQDTPGLLHAAHGGTLFLDEIDTMSPEMQASLLRTVETGEVRRVGDTHHTLVNTRIISATNADIDSLMDRGQFRRDLYYRLSVITIHVAPLRQRKDDIPRLAEHFLHAIANETGTPIHDLTPETVSMLQSYPWPGNVRQLQNALRQACTLASGHDLTPWDFTFLLKLDTSVPHGLVSLREYAHNAIRQFGGTVPWKDLSATLGVSRKTLWHWRRNLTSNGTHA